MFDLKGKVALVTGAASGIGFAFAKELLRNGLKAVALVDVNAKNGQKALSEITKEFGTNSAIFVKADVSDKVQFEDAFKTTVGTFKQLDIVINNAGILNERQWEKCVAVNLMAVITGSMLAMEKYFPKYKSSSEAVILNTASVAGLIAQDGFSAYCATKFGVVGFTRALSDTHFQKTKVRVLAICPGFTKTALLELDDNKVSEPYLSTFLGKREVLGYQKPEDVAENAINIIRNAPSGSVWLVVNKICTQATFPEYEG